MELSEIRKMIDEIDSELSGKMKSLKGSEPCATNTAAAMAMRQS